MELFATKKQDVVPIFWWKAYDKEKRKNRSCRRRRRQWERIGWSKLRNLTLQLDIFWLGF